MIIYSTMVNWQKMKIKVKNISSANEQLSVSGKNRESMLFRSSKMYTHYHWNKKRYHQIFSVFTTLQISMPHVSWRESYGQSYCMEVWVGKLESTSWKRWLIIHAELYFLSQILDQNKISLQFLHCSSTAFYK